MALRIKSRWHNEDSDRSMQEIAGAIAFNAWKIAKDKAINLHGEDFIYDSDEQRMGVIAEYLIFQIQLVDRMVHGILNEPERRTLVTELANKLAGHMQDNAEAIFGPGDYAREFVDRLNERAAEYAEYRFTDQGPSYPFMRHLGFEVQAIMGERPENRWVIDQVMDSDGPEVYRQLQRAVTNLLS